MKPIEFKATTILSMLGLLSRAAGSDGFQVDVAYEYGGAKVMCFPHTEDQAMAVLAFVKAFLWSAAVAESRAPRYGWVVTITIKEEETK